MVLNEFKECVSDMIEEIRDNLDTIEMNYPEIEMIDPIYNSNRFIDKLNMSGLLTEDLKDFINIYLKYYNS